MAEPERISDRRLDSWKEIASFFGRDERTVRRWEKENSLPVHRVPGSARGRVFAYESELSDWLTTPKASERDTGGPTSSAGQLQVITSSPKEQNRHPPVWQAVTWAGVVLVLGSMVFAIFAYRKNHGFAVHANGAAPHSGSESNAEDFYLKGRYYWNKRTPDDLSRAVDFFTQAIVQNPNYAPAYVGLADSYNLLREFSIMPASEAYPRARAAAQKAVELDPNSAEAHNSLAFALFWGYIDAQDAEREFTRALQLDPNNVRAHHWHATFLVEIAQFPAALAEIERARQLEPSSTAILADKGFILGAAGEYQQAISLLKQLEAAEPAFMSPPRYLAEIYFNKRDFEHYFQETQTMAKLEHDGRAESSLSALEAGYRSGGQHGLFEAKLRMDQQLYDQGLSSDFTLASDYSLLGNKSEALRHLKASYDKHELELCTILLNHMLDNIRSEPDFRELVDKLGLSQP